MSLFPSIVVVCRAVYRAVKFIFAHADEYQLILGESYDFDRQKLESRMFETFMNTELVQVT